MHINIYKQLHAVLKKYNPYRMTGNGYASYETQAKRKEIIFKFMKDLHKQGYKIKNINNLKRKHIRVVVHTWEDQGIKDLQTRISILKALCEWIGKVGMIGSAAELLQNPQASKKYTVAIHDLTWSGNGIDIESKLQEIAAIDLRVAVVLQLMLEFGLRIKEALLLKPHIADKQDYLQINRGTKGGRERIIFISQEIQKATLIQAKDLTNLNSSMIPDDKQFEPYRKHIYYICNRVGIGQRHGITPHGLRHEYANRLYTEITGCPSPIKNYGKITADDEQDRYARVRIANDLGHRRMAIAAIYIGGVSTGDDESNDGSMTAEDIEQSE